MKPVSRRAFLASAVAAAGALAAGARAQQNPPAAPRMRSQNAFMSIAPRAFPPHVRGNTGPASVMIAWNGAAYDPEGRVFYFHGGGHADYGGNEVYRYALATDLFERLTEPSPLDPAKAYHPLFGPRAAHTYGGFVWSRVARKCVLLAGGFGYVPGGITDENAGELWTFDPATRQWEFIRRTEFRTGGPRLTEMPDGRFFCGGSGRAGLAVLDPRDWGMTDLGNPGGWAFGHGMGVWDGRRECHWFIDARDLWRSRLAPRPVTIKAMENLYGVDQLSCLMMHEGKILAWRGGRELVRIDPDTQHAELFRFGQGPTPDKLMSKAAIVDGRIVGFPSHVSGCWEMPIPASGWVRLGERTAQSYLEEAAPGATVTIPPGSYPDGLRIRKSLTLNMKGVTLGEAVQGKAQILVETSEPVVINHASVRQWPPTDSAGAFIRDNGQPLDLTVNDADIEGAPNGILTGNPDAGRLVLHRCRIAKMSGTTSSHGIYAGMIGELVVTDCVISAEGITSNEIGHLLKSRARRGRIAGNTLDGGNGRYSREIDLPCGGDYVIEGNTIIKGPGSVQRDHVAFGTEPNWCRTPKGEQLCDRPGRFVFRRNKVVAARQSQFGTYRNAPGTLFEIADNHLPARLDWGSFPPGS